MKIDNQKEPQIATEFYVVPKSTDKNGISTNKKNDLDDIFFKIRVSSLRGRKSGMHTCPCRI